jgi:hypothetical protein
MNDPTPSRQAELYLGSLWHDRAIHRIAKEGDTVTIDVHLRSAHALEHAAALVGLACARAGRPRPGYVRRRLSAPPSAWDGATAAEVLAYLGGGE